MNSQQLAVYNAAQIGTVWRDCSHFGRFVVKGRDAATLLHHLTTNDVKGLKSNTGCDAALISAKGRLLDWLTVFRLEKSGDGYLVITSPNRRETFAPHFKSFVLFRQDVHIEEIANSSALWAEFGKGVFSQDAVSNRIERDEMGNYQAATHRLPQGGKWHWTLQNNQVPTFSSPPVDGETYNVLRIESGLPVAGNEISEDFNPWEAGLDASISLHKGCYNGQEIVARLNTYQKVKQRLRGVKFSGEVLGNANYTLQDKSGEKPRLAGKITSIAHSPRFGPIGLAMVRDEWSAPNTLLQVLADNEQVGEAVVCDLPFE